MSRFLRCLLHYVNVTSVYKNVATDFSSNTSQFGLHLQNIVLRSFPERRNARLHVDLSIVHATGHLPSWDARTTAARDVWQHKANPPATALSILHPLWKNSPPIMRTTLQKRDTLASQTALQALVLLQLNARNAASCTSTSQHRQFGVRDRSVNRSDSQ